MTDAEPLTSGADAVYLLDALDAAGIRVWVAGGWGVDALVGDQTREHRDLDVLIEMHDSIRALETLRAEGFAVTTDWFPVRFEMADRRGRVIDLHPVRFDERGDAHQELLDGRSWRFPAETLDHAGTIQGRAVRCLSPEMQVLEHGGYEHTDRDRHDLAVLAERFGVEVTPDHDG